MNIVTIHLVLIFVIVHCTQSLRCRSGNEKLSDEYKKIMQTCRRRYGESRDDDNSSTDDSNDSEDDSSSSDGSVFGHDFFSGSKRNENNNNEQFNNTRRMGDQSYRNYRQYKRNTDIRNYHATSMNNSTQTRSTRNRDYQYGIQNDNNSRNSNNGDQQSCRSHCFFNELNVVDRRGYPERISVTRVMTQGIKDPALRDFIEESLLECFHFLTSTMNLDKCSFSHYLLNCLTDKGKQECEDWND